MIDLPWYLRNLLRLAGIFFRFSRLVIGALTLRRALKRARPAVLPSSVSQLTANSRRHPRVCSVDGVRSPATYGLLRPVILLPLGFSDLTETQQLAVMCHELRR